MSDHHDAAEQQSSLPEREGVRGEIRDRRYRRINHGLFLRIVPDLPPDTEFLRELGTWQLVLPEGAVFTHVTGARLLGWPLPALPEQVPVFAAVRDTESRPRRQGLLCSRLVHTTEPLMVHGLPVDTPEEILLRAARDLGELDLGIMIEGALRLGHLKEEDMERLLASRRPGVRVLRAAYRKSDKRAESAGETVLRWFHDAIEVAVRPQAPLHDEAGHLVGRGDLLVVGTNFVHEYDGEVHRGKAQQRTDLRRGRGLAGTAYDRRGFTLDDLLNHALVVMHEIDRSLGREHDLRRFQRWRGLVEDSLYSEAGRARVMNRWYRDWSILNWSRTA